MGRGQIIGEKLSKGWGAKVLERLPVWILKSLRIMKEAMLERMTVVQDKVLKESIKQQNCGKKMTTTKSDIGIS